MLPCRSVVMRRCEAYLCFGLLCAVERMMNHSIVFNLSEQVVIDRGRIQEPGTCPRCNTQNTMEPIHNRGAFADKQLIKVQETPDSIPEGWSLMHQPQCDVSTYAVLRYTTYHMRGADRTVSAGH